MAEDILPEVELVWNPEAFMARNDNPDNSIASLRGRANEKNKHRPTSDGIATVWRAVKLFGGKVRWGSKRVDEKAKGREIPPLRKLTPSQERRRRKASAYFCRNDHAAWGRRRRRSVGLLRDDNAVACA
jgi:hypothetical protein